MAYLPPDVITDYESFLADNNLENNEDAFHDFVNNHLEIYESGYVLSLQIVEMSKRSVSSGISSEAL